MPFAPAMPKTRPVGGNRQRRIGGREGVAGGVGAAEDLGGHGVRLLIISTQAIGGLCRLGEGAAVAHCAGLARMGFGPQTDFARPKSTFPRFLARSGVERPPFRGVTLNRTFPRAVGGRSLHWDRAHQCPPFWRDANGRFMARLGPSADRSGGRLERTSAEDRVGWAGDIEPAGAAKRAADLFLASRRPPSIRPGRRRVSYLGSDLRSAIYRTLGDLSHCQTNWAPLVDHAILVPFCGREPCAEMQRRIARAPARDRQSRQS